MNTLGAMSGTLLSGLDPDPGDRHSTSFLLAATLNVIVGVVALWLARRVDLGSRISDADQLPISDRPIGNPRSIRNPRSAIRNRQRCAIVVAVSGFASLGLEIVWFRLMLQFVIATTEAFTAMLTTVLGGIAIGGLIAAWLLRSPRDHHAALGIVQALTGVAAAASMTFLLWTVEQGWNTMGLWPAVLLAILPPSIFMGIGFPLALGIAGARVDPNSP